MKSIIVNFGDAEKDLVVQGEAPMNDFSKNISEIGLACLEKEKSG